MVGVRCVAIFFLTFIFYLLFYLYIYFLFFLKGGSFMYFNEFSVLKYVSFDSDKSSLTVQGFRSDFKFNLLCHSTRVDSKFFENCSAGDLLLLNIRNSYNVNSKTSGKKVSYPLVVGVEKWDPTFADNLNSVRSFLGVSENA